MIASAVITPCRMREPDVASSASTMQGRWSNMLYVAPYLFLYVTLLVYPLFAGFWLSLHKADFFGGSRFVGLQNFARLFDDKVFLGAVGNTFYFILLTLPALAVMPLVTRAVRCCARRCRPRRSSPRPTPTC